jgi:hypothetical protein
MLRRDQLPLLKGVPSQWRLALTGGGDDAKRCFEDGWNQPGAGYSVDDVLRLNETPTPSDRWKSRKMIGLGAITGPESNGLLVIDFDGVGSQAIRAFKAHFNRGPKALPPTVANLSGKKGRAKLYFQVPPHWWHQLEGKSASWRNLAGNVVLEAIWQNGTGNGRHAVIVGDHPESSHQRPLYYRWAEGHGPSEVAVAEAPEWLLLGVLAQTESISGERTREERQRSGEDDGTPWERLSAWERRELAESALEFCPNRLARGSGTYEKVRRILCGLINEFGLSWAEEIVTGSQWNTKNEWDGGNDAEKTLRSLAKSRVSEEQKSRIASLFYFAREGGWLPPSWAIPPVDTKIQVEGLRKLVMQVIRNQEDSVAVRYLFGRAKKEFGVDSDGLRQEVLQQYLGQVDRREARTLAEITMSVRKDSTDLDVIDGFLGRRVHLLAGSSHAGKTTLACFLTNRVVHGLPLDIDGTRHSVEKPGKVLIFTSDCSDMDMVRDLPLEAVDGGVGDRVKVCSGVTFDNMIRIVKTLDEFAPDLVIYDCLTSMSSRDVKIGDPNYGAPIRDLVRYNGVAWPRCAHLVLHHTTRDEPTRFSGTEQIKAACDELWVYYPPELMKWRRGQPMPQIGPTRLLKFEKSRTGYMNKQISITRNAYQSHWQLHLCNPESGGPMDVLSSRFRSVTHDKWQIASEWSKELDLEFNSRSLRRYLDQLVGTLLESRRLRSQVTGRLDTHYRPRATIREAASHMTGSRCDGMNQV